MNRLEVMLKRTIPTIEINYIWKTSVEEIVVDLGPPTPKKIIPDILHNIARFFQLATKNV